MGLDSFVARVAKTRLNLCVCVRTKLFDVVASGRTRSQERQEFGGFYCLPPRERPNVQTLSPVRARPVCARSLARL